LKRKILHLIPQLQFSDGIQSYVRTLCECYNENLYDISVITFYVKNNDRIVEELEKRSVNVIALRESLFERINNRYLKFFLKNIIVPYIYKFLSLKKLITELQPELVFAHGEDSELLCGFTNNIKCKVNVIHGKTYFPRNIFYRYILSNCSRKRYIHTIIVNKNLKSLVNKQNKVFTITVGIDILKYDEIKIIDFEKGKEIIFGYIGRLSREKNIQNLISAFNRLAEKYSDIKLIGNHKSNLIKRVLPSLKNRIIFVGLIEDNKEFYSKIDVFVHPSPNEGGPITVLEALAAKRIVLAPDAGIVAQALKNGENGIILNNTAISTLYNSMEHIINNYEHFFYFTKNTTKYLKPFSKDEFIQKFYDKLDIILSDCH